MALASDRDGAYCVLAAAPASKASGGGGGTIGASNVARAPAEGHTLLFSDTSTQVIAPAIVATPPYDPTVSFMPVATVATSSTSIVVHPSVPARTLSEFVDYARAQGKIHVWLRRRLDSPDEVVQWLSRGTLVCATRR